MWTVFKVFIEFVTILLLAQMVKTACNAGDSGWIPGWGRSPGEGTSHPLQYSCLENPMDRGIWQAIVHGVTKQVDKIEHTWYSTKQRPSPLQWTYRAI